MSSVIRAAESAILPNGVAEAGAASLSLLAKKVAQADMQGRLTAIIGKADQLLTDSVFPAARTSFTLAKEKISLVDLSNSATQAKDKISQVNINNIIADGASLSNLAMVGSLVAGNAALSLAKQHISRGDVKASIADAMDKSQEIMAGVRPAAENVSTHLVRAHNRN